MHTDTSLRGKTAFISGGSRGIGLEIGKRLAAEGANIVIAMQQVSTRHDGSRPTTIDGSVAGDAAGAGGQFNFSNSCRLRGVWIERDRLDARGLDIGAQRRRTVLRHDARRRRRLRFRRADPARRAASFRCRRTRRRTRHNTRC